MRKKTKILLASYLSVLILALALYAWAGQWGLGWYRRSTGESASLAYEETVRSVQELSEALEKSLYATDPEMCDRICCEAYARAAAAESALATLPFSTQELEKLAAFLNTAGDYVYSLCGSGRSFSTEQRRDLQGLSETAARSAERLLALRQELNDKALTMDSRERRLQNVGTETGPLLSGELLAYEDELEPLALRYDGQFGRREERRGGLMTEQEMLRAAAEFLDLPEEELKLLYDYAGSSGLHCYRAGDSYLCVSRAGVQSMAQDRLVAEAVLSLEEAQQKAEELLARRSYGELELLEGVQRGNIAQFTYARTQDGALCPDDRLQIAIALDDGSLYSFDASRFDPAPLQLHWALDEEAASAALPEGLAVRSARRAILESAGGQALPCYVFSCADESGREVEISVSAETGRQVRIEEIGG